VSTDRVDRPARLDERRWPQVASVAASTLLAVPLGSTEQHGPHLPFGTDTIIATALADRLASARGDVVVAPALPYGSSGEHAGFDGTLSIGGPALELVAVELVRSADAFAGVVFVCGHGGNAEALRSAAATLAGEGREVLVWHPSAAGGDAHAGRKETSMLLSLVPRFVDVDRAEVGDTRPLAEILPQLRSGGVISVVSNGVLGDPTGASASEGDQLLDRLGADLLRAVQAWRP
jgi:mycofactocin precursor peptide peptidase